VRGPDLRRLLEGQRAAIGKTLAGRSQIPLDFGEMEKEQRDQYERDKRHMEGRLGALPAGPSSHSCVPTPRIRCTEALDR
jgi:hypothetical protein